MSIETKNYHLVRFRMKKNLQLILFIILLIIQNVFAQIPIPYAGRIFHQNLFNQETLISGFQKISLLKKNILHFIYTMDKIFLIQR